ncbi:phosphoglycerate mutase-like protein [Irpex rosettiformis]|uniref:Phosphoglycerate mutase-like protein n=1 Tax=Irpex rosettiformis TaxID=378272 RepID=A0ACB8TSJ7_9APHY|nr:phosphoglycerate mutase-like protein [Irpex rosettiformis]
MRCGNVALVVTLVALAVSGSHFDPLKHSGPASPYFDAPPRFGVPSMVPPGCVVDRASYIMRHGARFPEPGSFNGWIDLFYKFQNTSFTATGDLTFLPTWIPPVDDEPHEPLFLTSHGAAEAFRLGAELRGRYRLTSGGNNFTVWSAGQQRVVDTATYFLRGYLSQGNYLNSTSSNRGTIFTLPDSVNFTGADSLTPSTSCPNYSGNDGSIKSGAFRTTYQPDIAKRLNKMLKGLALDETDVGVMQDLCGFSFVIDGDRRFCDIFTEKEWLDYEYAHDLNYYYGSGPGNPISGATAFPWVKAIASLLNDTLPANATFTPPSLIISVTHDNNIPPIAAALGILNSSITDPHAFPLSTTEPNPLRTFFASNIVNFLGHVAFERLTCEKQLGEEVQHVAGTVNAVPGAGESSKKYVRVLVNNAVVPLPTCQDGPGRACALADFQTYVQARGEFVGDFVQRCGLGNSTTTIPDTVDFYTNPESVGAHISVEEVPGL